jgi:methionine-R-sulfoxide reductase
MADTELPPIPSDDELRDRLTPLQYEVTQKAGTERAFTGAYWDTKEPGVYRCIVCDQVLFMSDTKYDSGSGWPSFTEPVESGAVTLHTDSSHGMERTEVRCGRCGAHLGHVFPDGPGPTGERFCMNSASLRLEASEKE